MAAPSETFSESWYRIAQQRISLRPGVKSRRQNFRGQRWIILENPFSNQFFRLTPSAFDFVGRLRPNRTVEEVWTECLTRFPDEAPGQEAVLQLLSQLYLANLLQYEVATDSSKLFDRYKRAQQRDTRSKLQNVMFMRFPLLDPDEFLSRTMPVVGKLISPFGAVLWLIVVGFAVKLGIDNFGALKDRSQGVLDPGNLFLLYIGLVFVKTLHEFGHAYFCKKFGGEVHVIGVMLMIFTPTPYMDATSSWGFRSRKQRILVGAAGMIVEVFVAALAMFVWIRTPAGPLNSVAYNIIFIASVSTLLFNLIPLLRFDGYYILSDLVDIPNLQQRSSLQLRHLVEHYAFGVRKSESPAQSPGEARWLTVFGMASGIYRIFVFGRVLLFVADRLLLIGIIMAAVCAVAWVIVPVIRLFQYLASNPRLERHRVRAILVSAAAAALIIVLLDIVPFPNHFRAPGILEARAWTQVVNPTPGFVEKIITLPGRAVRKGEPLLQLRNQELDLQIQAQHAALAEAKARLLQAMKTGGANLKPLNSHFDSVQKRLERLLKQKDELTVTARQDGLWVSPQLEESVGRWLPRGNALGLIVDPAHFEFVATVIQDDVDHLFALPVQSAEVRLTGQSEIKLSAVNLRRIPAEQHVLPSPILGASAGGEIPVARNDSKGQRAAEPFFTVLADVQQVPGVSLLHGRAGKIRFALPSEPLLPRWIRAFRQMIQKRYQL